MRTQVVMISLVLLLPMTTFTPVRATDYFVNGTAMSSGDGSDWSEAFVTIGEATSLAGPGDRVFVAGREAPSPLVYAESITVASAVELAGGYAPIGAPAIIDRDPARYITIIDGQNINNEVVEIADNATNATVVDGFTITGGVHHGVKNGDTSQCQFRSLNFIANGSTPATSNGAGIHCGDSGSFPRILNCEFSSNKGISGGAIYCPGDSTFRATNCRFIGNEALGGGAVYVAPLTPPSFSEIPPKPLPSISGAFTSNQLRHCYFQGNQATSGDGGTVNFSGEFYAISCQFIGNTAAPGSGGGVECAFGSLLGVNLEFVSNATTGHGALTCPQIMYQSL